MNGRVNYYFATAEQRRTRRAGSATSRPSSSPTIRRSPSRRSATTTSSRSGRGLPALRAQPQARRALLGDRPDGNGDLRELFVQRSGDPALRSAARVRLADRRRTDRPYCATYNNGVGPDGLPDIDLVTRASRVPPVAQQFIGKCTPVACVAGKVAEPCKEDTDCDSSARRRRRLVRRLPDHRRREHGERDVRPLRRAVRRPQRTGRRSLVPALSGVSGGRKLFDLAPRRALFTAGGAVRSVTLA